MTRAACELARPASSLPCSLRRALLHPACLPGSVSSFLLAPPLPPLSLRAWFRRGSSCPSLLPLACLGAGKPLRSFREAVLAASPSQSSPAARYRRRRRRSCCPQASEREGVVTHTGTGQAQEPGRQYCSIHVPIYEFRPTDRGSDRLRFSPGPLVGCRCLCWVFSVHLATHPLPLHSTLAHVVSHIPWHNRPESSLRTHTIGTVAGFSTTPACHWGPSPDASGLGFACHLQRRPILETAASCCVPGRAICPAAASSA